MICSALAINSSKHYSDLILWHERLGHLNVDYIHRMSANDSCSNFKLGKQVQLQHPCEGCMLGKQHKSTYNHDPQKQRSVSPGELLHGDVSGKQYKTPSLKGSKYYILYKDDATAYRFVHFAQSKSEAFPFFKRVVQLVKKETGHNILALRTNQGTEFLNATFDKYLDDMNISRQLSTTYTPQQNGYIERDNRTVMEMARSMLHAKDLPTILWVEAVNTAVYILNRTINYQLGTATPYERWFGSKPSINHLQVFGSLSWVFINNQVRSKLDPKSVQAYFVGYSSTSRAYRFWNPVTNKVFESADYNIDKNSGKFRFSFPPDPGRDQFVSISIDPIPSSTGPAIQFQQPPDIINNNSDEVVEDLRSSGSMSTGSFPRNFYVHNDVNLQLHDTSPAVGVSSNPSILLTSSPVEPPNIHDEPLDPKFRSIQELLNSTPRLPDFPNFPELQEEPEPPDLSRLDPMHRDVIRLSDALLASVGATIHEPQTYHEALSSSDSKSWQEAMDKEYSSLIENQTWELVKKPSDRKPVQHKWVYKIKYKSSGQIDKFKARLVAKGFTQRHGVDFSETYSPVI